MAITLCLLIMLFIGYCICKYLDSCKHTWTLVSKSEKNLCRRDGGIIGFLYIHEYKCEKCGIYKVTQHNVH